MTLLRKLESKTYKREVAMIMLIHIIYLSTLGDNLEVVRILITPYMLFIVAAFGLDSLRKQMDVKYTPKPLD